MVRRHSRAKQGVKNPTGELKVGSCEVCDKWSNPLQLDHCHKTGIMRGWLCGTCNRAAGQAKDDPVLLRKLADYLEKHTGLINSTVGL